MNNASKNCLVMIALIESKKEEKLKKKLTQITKYLLLSITGLILILYSSFYFYFLIGDYFNKQNNPLFDSIYSHKQSPHMVTLIDNGAEGLKKRLELIKNAKESIELEYFIYDVDAASKIITDALIQKAMQGVKIRILVDFSQPIFKLKPFYSYLLNQYGIEIKYYNTSELYQIFTVQHRSHRKLLIIDSKKAITGGRNIGNDYFDLSSKYNFLDSDILIEGEIVKSIKKSFNLYWNSPYASTADTSQLKTENLKDAITFFKTNNETNKIVEQLNKTIFKAQQYTCNDIVFVTDSPGVLVNNRRVFQELSKIVTQARKTLKIESPYFVIKKGGLKLLQKVHQNGVKTSILTNGLYSTDAFYTVSALYDSISDLKDLNIKLSTFSGKRPQNDYLVGEFKASKRWGTHAKRAVIDDSISIIGTYNVDPRSANINSENIIVCNNGDELASAISKSIDRNTTDSFPVLDKNKINYQNITKNATNKQLWQMHIVRPITYLFDNLL